MDRSAALFRCLASSALLLAALSVFGCSGTTTEGVTSVVDFTDVHFFARCAKAAYEVDDTKVASFLDEIGYDATAVATLEAKKIRYFLATEKAGGRQLISVRGTANIKNGLEDMEILKEHDAHTGVKLHRGFTEDARSILDDLKPKLESDKPLWITGHSLGGAVALVLAMHLDVEGYQVDRVVTFGQPKVTDRKGVKRFRHLPVKRVVDEHDLVPLVPPIELTSLATLDFYRHLGEEVVLLDGIYYSFLDERQAESGRVSAFWKRLLGHANIPDHYMDNYHKRIEPKLDGAERVPYADRHKYIKRKGA